MRKTVLAAVASFTIASGAGAMQASAADFFQPAPVPAPILHDWSGFYIGGHVGYGEANFTARSWAFAPDNTRLYNVGEALDPGGIVGGLQGGFNWQTGAFVLGVEADISFVDWDDSATASVDDVDFDPTTTANSLVDVAGSARSSVNFLASVRGRAGIAFDQLLLYGTGGIAFSDAETRFRASIDGTEVHTETLDFDDIGWVVGGGAEWAAIPNRFSVGAEGLFYIFDDRETRRHVFAAGEVTGIPEDTDVRATSAFHNAWVVRARANFHF